MTDTHKEQAVATGQLMRARRTEQNLTIQQVADHVGLHKNYVSLLERGQYNPLRSRHASALFALLGISAEDLRAIAPDLLITLNDPRPAGKRLIHNVGPLRHASSPAPPTDPTGDDDSLALYNTSDLLSGTIEHDTYVPADLQTALAPGSVIIWHTLHAARPGHLTVFTHPDGRAALARTGGDPNVLLITAGPGTTILRGADLSTWTAHGPVVQIRTHYPVP